MKNTKTKFIEMTKFLLKTLKECIGSSLQHTSINYTIKKYQKKCKKLKKEEKKKITINYKSKEKPHP